MCYKACVCDNKVCCCRQRYVTPLWWHVYHSGSLTWTVVPALHPLTSSTSTGYTHTPCAYTYCAHVLTDQPVWCACWGGASVSGRACAAHSACGCGAPAGGCSVYSPAAGCPAGAAGGHGMGLHKCRGLHFAWVLRITAYRTLCNPSTLYVAIHAAMARNASDYLRLFGRSALVHTLLQLRFSSSYIQYVLISRLFWRANFSSTFMPE